MKTVQSFNRSTVQPLNALLVCVFALISLALTAQAGHFKPGVQMRKTGIHGSTVQRFNGSTPDGPPMPPRPGPQLLAMLKSLPTAAPIPNTQHATRNTPDPDPSSGPWLTDASYHEDAFHPGQMDFSVCVQHMQEGHTYELQSSFDLRTWAKVPAAGTYTMQIDFPEACWGPQFPVVPVPEGFSGHCFFRAHDITP